jgi:hypothetical protein
MIALNENSDLPCLKLINAYFERFPNPHLHIEVVKMFRALLDFDYQMPGNPGGWAGGMIYAFVNRYRRACGIPKMLNKESEDFFGVSMDVNFKRKKGLGVSSGA